MDNKLYLVSDGTVAVMNEVKYEKELDLQKLIKDNPALVSRGKNSPDLYFVAEELSMLETPEGSNTFSLDLLLVDDTGLPTLVEVKRSTDTRLKREVVGQLLDYASCIISCDTASLRESFEKYHEDDSDCCISTGEFWQTVEANLQLGKMNLVFAADEIPRPLERMILFLDSNMPSINVYGAVIQQYLSNGVQLLSTSIVNAKDVAVAPSKKVELLEEGWNDETFFALLARHGLESVMPVFEKIRAAAIVDKLTVISGKGTKVANFLFKKSNGNKSSG